MRKFMFYSSFLNNNPFISMKTLEKGPLRSSFFCLKMRKINKACRNYYKQTIPTVYIFEYKKHRGANRRNLLKRSVDLFDISHFIILCRAYSPKMPSIHLLRTSPRARIY